MPKFILYEIHWDPCPRIFGTYYFIYRHCEVGFFWNSLGNSWERAKMNRMFEYERNLCFCHVFLSRFWLKAQRRNTAGPANSSLSNHKGITLMYIPYFEHITSSFSITQWTQQDEVPTFHFGCFCPFFCRWVIITKHPIETLNLADSLTFHHFCPFFQKKIWISQKSTFPIRLNNWLTKSLLAYPNEHWFYELFWWQDRNENTFWAQATYIGITYLIDTH